jgi:tRNA pseudouridine32 synthase/23S rRNA pseudouridine746 synthase/23S rRNA pseudouridine1911/1915/1917 synthase
MSPDRYQMQTAQCLLSDYLRKGASRSRLQAYVVHRLDRETSGLLIFAKTEAVQHYFRENWKSVEKQYLAIVHGSLAEKSGTRSSYLAENAAQFVYSTTQTQGKWSETQYEVIRENKKFSELKINLLTGRKNQIRVHFSEAGHPVVGDTKYGPKGEKFERMALHSRMITFNHPHSGKQMTFEAPVPKFFNRLMQ